MFNLYKLDINFIASFSYIETYLISSFLSSVE
jgi:hypothetical protein